MLRIMLGFKCTNHKAVCYKKKREKSELLHIPLKDRSSNELGMGQATLIPRDHKRKRHRQNIRWCDDRNIRFGSEMPT